MELSSDELAGIADLFGALPRPALERAIEEVAFRAGDEVSAATVEAWIDEAESEYALVAVDLDGDSHLAPGPTAFPELPDAANDLPHILDVDRQSVPPEAIETAVRRRLASAAANIEDPDRASALIDVTYDAEAWAGLDLADVRERLAAIGADPG